MWDRLYAAVPEDMAETVSNFHFPLFRKTDPAGPPARHWHAKAMTSGLAPKRRALAILDAAAP